MARQGSFRAIVRDTSPGRWFSRIPSTLSPGSTLALRRGLNLVPKQPPPAGKELGSLSTCAIMLIDLKKNEK